MVQYVRPDNDDAIGVWRDDGGGSTNIFQAIDEPSPDTNDWIESDNTPVQSETCDIGGSTVTDPVTDENHILRWLFNKSNTGGRTIEVWLELRQGATVITTRNFMLVSNFFMDDIYTLTPTEADSITDYSDLNFRWYAERTGTGAARRLQVFWAEFRVPNVGGEGTPINLINSSAGI